MNKPVLTPSSRCDPHPSTYEPSPLDTLYEKIDPGKSSSSSVVTDSFSNWLTTDLAFRAYREGNSVAFEDEYWTVPSTFKLYDLVVEDTLKLGYKSFYPRGGSCYYLVWEDGSYVTMRKGNRSVNTESHGSPAFIKRVRGIFEEAFSRVESHIEWIVDSRLTSITIPLEANPVYDSYYPWLGKSVDEYYQEYLNSSANILLLIGPPGTGKTTFIKNLIVSNELSGYVTYDSEVLSQDGMFARFIGGSEDVLVIEDADRFLASRQDGNDLMHKFLNVGDGMVSVKGKKVIFSTNLPNTSSIDPALIRPGRCFDVLQFKSLTKEQAIAACKDSNRDPAALPDKDSFTLAEIFNTPKHSIVGIRPKMGF